MHKLLLTMSLLGILCANAANTVPCSLEIPDENSFNTEWTVIDANAATSPNTWTYSSNSAVYTEDKKNAANDWIISSAVTLEKGKSYYIYAYVANQSIYSSDKQKYQITAGNSNTVEAQTTKIYYEESYQTKTFTKKGGIFTPPESGEYYIGVQCYSASYMGNFALQKVTVEEKVPFPAEVTDFLVTPGSKGALSATLSWKYPTVDTDGNPLVSLSGAKIYRENDSIGVTQDAVVGADASWTDNTLTTPGSYRYKIVTYSAAGNSNSKTTVAATAYIGNDTPKAVTNLVATVVNDSIISVNFTPPTEGVNGGYVDTNALTYKIARNTTDVLEENYSGTLPYLDKVPGLNKYTYTVTPIFAEKKGSSATSAGVVTSGAVALPYTQNFDDASSIDFFTVIDGNSDGNTWKYQTSKRCAQYWGGNAADEWLITPKVKLEAGKAYKLTYTAGIENSATAASYKTYSVTLGKGATIEAQDTALFTETLKSAIMQSKEIMFSVAEAGEYNLSYHCEGITNSYAILVDNIKLEETVMIPAPADTLIAVPAAEGALAATLSWNNPNKTNAGTELSAITKYEIYRGADLVTTKNNPVVGAEEQYVDNSVEKSGTYQYKVVFYSGANASEPTLSKSIWLGPDVPKPVTSLTVTVANDTLVSINFTAPTEGVNGGYVNPSAFTYKIVRNATDTIEDAYSGTLPYVDNIKALAKYTYTVFPIFAGLEGAGVTSDAVIAGTSLDIPYEQTFSNSSSLDLFTIIDGNSDSYTWKYYSSRSLVYFWGGSTADEWLITPKIKLEAGKAYKLTYTAGLESSKASSYKTYSVTMGQGNTAEAQNTVLFEETLKSTIMSAKEVKFSVAESGIYNLSYHCTGISDYNAIYIDNIKIEETIAIPAPADTLIAVAAANGALGATISWSNPTKTSTGSDLSTITKYEIYRGENLISTKDNPVVGANEQYVDNQITEIGNYQYKVLFYLGSNPSEPTMSNTIWVGPDTPDSVSNVVAKLVNDVPTITFTAPKAGVNGGYIDTSALKYKIVREPNSVVLTDVLTDTVYTDNSQLALASYTYTVYALIGSQESAGVTSNKIVCGDALDLPYSTTFDDRELWTIKDANNDGKTWAYNSTKNRMEYTAYSAADDWIYTPRFNVTNGGAYNLSLSMTVYGTRYPESFEVVMTNSADPSAPYSVLASYPEYKSADSTPFEIKFQIPSSGVIEGMQKAPSTSKLYIGIHATSSDPWGLYLGAVNLRTDPESGVDLNKLNSFGGYYNNSNMTLVIAPNSSVAVYSMAGVLVMSQNNAEEEINLSNIPAGFYVATVTTENGNVQQIKFKR